jgi:hypothetical protein
MLAECSCAAFEPDPMTESCVPPNVPVAFPSLVTAYAKATNSFDPERLMAIFAENAPVNHQGNFIVTANVDGKRGFPDPLMLVFYPMRSPKSSTRPDNAFCAGKRQARERPVS